MSESPFKINAGIPIWSLITGLVVIAVMWGTLSSQTNANAKSIIDLRDSQTDLTRTLTDLRISSSRQEASLGSLQTDVSFIKNKLR